MDRSDVFRNDTVGRTTPIAAASKNAILLQVMRASAAALWFIAGLFGSGCIRVNESHCGNIEGNDTCRRDHPREPWCNICVGDNDGCVQDPVPSECQSKFDASASIADMGTDVDPGMEGHTGTSMSTGTTVNTDSGTLSTGLTMFAETTSSGSGTETFAQSTGMPSSTSSTSEESSTDASTGDGPVCGDGVRDPDETCDTDDLNGLTCQDLGSEGDGLRCTDDCIFDPSGCEGFADACGDGVIQAPEQCDGGNLNGSSCADLFADRQGGQLGCTSCVYDTSDCCITDTEACSVNADCCSGTCSGIIGLLLTCQAG